MGETGQDERKTPSLNPAFGKEGSVPSASRGGIKSYVLRSGRMSPAQKRSYEELSPRFSVPFDSGGGTLDYRALFGNDSPVTVEIGFGMGTATAEIAQANPGQNYLGLEVYRPGIGRLLWEIERRGLTNIRIIEHDAVETLENMAGDGSLAAFHIFFPDPWPKKRHHKRRLVTRPFTDLLARKLEDGGYVYMVTDWEDYARRAMAELSATPLLFNPYAGPHGGPSGDCTGKVSGGGFTKDSAGEGSGEFGSFAGGFARGFAPRQLWRPRTSFEAKGIAGQRRVWELFFRKIEGKS